MKNWNPIDTAPEFMSVLIYCPSRFGGAQWVARLDGDDLVWNDPAGDFVCKHPGDATHWMPLPSAPTQVGAA